MSARVREGMCASVGNHVWMYPGRKWPYVGQPCACGATVWPDKPPRRVASSFPDGQKDGGR